jgi:hypothetical protein
VNCPKCAASNPDSNRFCSNCGQSLSTATSKPDFVDYYRGFLQDFAGKKYDRVWSLSTLQSKKAFCKMVALASKGQMTEEDIYTCIEENRNDYRTKVFEWITGIVSPNEYLEKARFIFKSATDSTAVVTIEVDGTPADCSVVKEGDGVWRVNFFEDMIKLMMRFAP